MMENLKSNWLVVSKLTWRIWRILTWTLRNLKNLHFNGLLLSKGYNVWAKKRYRRVFLHGPEYWCNIWRKTALCFQKFHEEFSKFSAQHVQKSKNRDFDGILLSKVENLWAQNLQGKFMSWQWRMIQRFEEAMTCDFKIDTRNLTNFDPRTPKSQKFICTLIGCFWRKYVMLELKKV